MKPTQNIWQQLKESTEARIGLQTVGSSIATHHLLEFNLAHAMAKDALHQPFQTDTLSESFRQKGFKTIVLQSEIQQTSYFLQFPNKGRKLSIQSQQEWTFQSEKNKDLCIVCSAGLSAQAVQEQAVEFVAGLHHNLKKVSFERIVLVPFGRVAIGDMIADISQSKAVLVLIGERPGLTAPKSMGLYYTWNPRVGLTDESRNCISNIRPGGLSISEAIQVATLLIEKSFQHRISGTSLKLPNESTKSVNN